MDTYRSTNTLNGKFYIGSTLNFEKRKKQHLRSQLNRPFQNALRKNPEVFEWEVFKDDSLKRELEQALLDMFFGTSQCYNLNKNAYVPTNSGKTRWWNPTTGEETISFEPPEGEWVLGGKPRGDWYHCPTTKKVERFDSSDVPEGWVKGRGPDFSKVTSEMQVGPKNHRYGLTYWKHEELQTELMSQTCPGEGWSEGRISRSWWVNSEGLTKFSLECPGPKWKLGRKWIVG